jgi:cell division protein FtsB
MAYFGYHAWSGRYGIESMRRLEDEAVRLEFELAAIKLRRQALEAKVMLLRDGSIERDMLDEQARNTLNVLKPDELAILRGKTL